MTTEYDYDENGVMLEYRELDINDDGSVTRTRFYHPDETLYRTEPPESHLFTVTYAPGLHGTFLAVSTRNIVAGALTPDAPATPGEDGWEFTGWSPTRRTTVTGYMTYTAQWRQTQSATPRPATCRDPDHHGENEIIQTFWSEPDSNGTRLRAQVARYSCNCFYWARITVYEVGRDSYYYAISEAEIPYWAR